MIDSKLIGPFCLRYPIRAALPEMVRSDAEVPRSSPVKLYPRTNTSEERTAAVSAVLAVSPPTKRQSDSTSRSRSSISTLHRLLIMDLTSCELARAAASPTLWFKAH